jgi:bacillolysin
MTYGDGTILSPLVSTDVVGHEITHGITQYTANLTYSYEPGALNESFSDIFGTVVEFYADPTCSDWKIGEDITATVGKAYAICKTPTYTGSPTLI